MSPYRDPRKLRFFALRLLGIAFLCAFAVPISSALAAPKSLEFADRLPAALILDGETSLFYPGGAAFELGADGTIEFQVAAAWQQDPGYFPCVLASRNEPATDEPQALAESTRYSVHVNGARSEIGFFNGRAWGWAPFDFTDGEYHRVAFITRGDRTEVVIDGESIAILPLGYGSGAGLPLHVGSSSQKSDFFIGRVLSLRLWSTALSAADLAELEGVYGAAASESSLAVHLAAYSAFSKDRYEIATAASSRVRTRNPKAEAVRRAKLLQQAKRSKAKQTASAQGGDASPAKSALKPSSGADQAGDASTPPRRRPPAGSPPPTADQDQAGGASAPQRLRPPGAAPPPAPDTGDVADGATPPRRRPSTGSEPLTQEDLAELEKNPALRKRLGKLTVANQKDFSEALAETSMSTAVSGFGRLSRSDLTPNEWKFASKTQAVLKNAQKLARKRAAKDGIQVSSNDGDILLSAIEIQTLLKSPASAERKAGNAALKAIHDLSQNPEVVSKAFLKTGLPIAARLSEDPVAHDTLVQTSFIKWSRQIAARSYFEGALPNALDSRMRKRPKLPHGAKLPEGESINDYIANVGFNRLLSDNNLLGASLSSDVDFKLVVADGRLRAKMNEGRKSEMTDAEFGEVLDAVKEKLVGELKVAQKRFLDDYQMTLEVDEKFTVKSMTQLKGELGFDADGNIDPDGGNQQEKNFLSTVLKNSSLLGGNKKVRDDFLDIVDNAMKKDSRGLSKRNFEQNLGESDKGSIAVIRNLPSIEKLLDGTTKLLGKDPLLRAAVKKIIDMEAKLAQDGAEGPLKLDPKAAKQSVDEFLADPKNLQKLMSTPKLPSGDDFAVEVADFKTRLFGKIRMDPDTNAAHGDLDLFRDRPLDEVISLSVKLRKGFTKEVEDPETGKMVKTSNFIGRKSEGKGPWVYSVKFAGARLNDWFDMTPKGEFTNAADRPGYTGRKKKVLQRDYDDAKIVAEGINEFAVQLQNRTYEQGRRKGKTHEQLDTLYDHISGAEFADMMSHGPMKQRVEAMLDSLVGDLSKLEVGRLDRNHESLHEKLDMSARLAGIRTLKADLQSLSPTDSDRAAELGRGLFTTLFQLADTTATSLREPASAAQTAVSTTVP